MDALCARCAPARPPATLSPRDQTSPSPHSECEIWSLVQWVDAARRPPPLCPLRDPSPSPLLRSDEVCAKILLEHPLEEVFAKLATLAPGSKEEAGAYTRPLFSST